MRHQRGAVRVRAAAVHLAAVVPPGGPSPLRQEGAERGGPSRGESEHLQQREDHPRDREHRPEPHQVARAGGGPDCLRSHSQAEPAEPARVQGPRHQRTPEGGAGRPERQLRRPDLLRPVQKGAGDRTAA